jgi:hypothetical protein
MRFLVVALFLVCLGTYSFSQDSLSSQLPLDTLNYHSPKKAVIYSAILPGAGQVYNHIAMPKGQKKAFWKVPLIYAGLGTMTYFLISNQQTQRSLRKEYEYRIDGQTVDPEWELYDDAAIDVLYNQYLNRRDFSILGLGAVYLIQIVDAGIEAHFVKFDISEDLTLAIEPAYFGRNTAGLNLRFNFR